MDSFQNELKSLFDSVSLGQLSIPDIDFGDVGDRLAEQEKILKKFEDKYGEEEGWTKYLEYRNKGEEYGSIAKIINKIIYDGCSCYIRGIHLKLRPNWMICWNRVSVKSMAMNMISMFITIKAIHMFASC